MLRACHVPLSARAQLAVRVLSPGEDGAAGGDGHAVVGAAGDGPDGKAAKGLQGLQRGEQTHICLYVYASSKAWIALKSQSLKVTFRSQGVNTVQHNAHMALKE